MPRARSQRDQARRLAVLFLGLSVAVSLGFLSVRNLYDDELANVAYIGARASRIIAFANSQDVHPPGQYLLTALAYKLIPSVRWMTLVPLAFFYAGLLAFLSTFAPLLPRGRARIAFLLLACLHPQMLMWSNSVRWYSAWTGLALLTLVLVLRPGCAERTSLTLSFRRALLLGLLLAALFYLNYQTILFVPALLAAALLRFGLKAWRALALSTLTAVMLAAPQLHAMIFVHMAHSRMQRGSIAISAARLALSLTASEAYLPWHPMAILAVVAGATLTAIALRRAGRLWTLRRLRPTGPTCLLLFAVAFGLLLTISGLGTKPRNGLLLVPTLAPAAALVICRLRPPMLGRVLIFGYALWSAGGIAHLLSRSGLAKGSMIDRPEELIAALRRNAPAAPACRVVITYDDALAVQTVLAHLPRTAVMATRQMNLYRDASALPADCASFDLISVTTPLDLTRKGNSAVLAEAAANLPEISSPIRLSHDPDAATKRRLAWLTGVTNTPDDRIILHQKTVTAAEFTRVLAAMPHFVLADGYTLPRIDVP